MHAETASFSISEGNVAIHPPHPGAQSLLNIAREAGEPQELFSSGEIPSGGRRTRVRWVRKEKDM